MSELILAEAGPATAAAFDALNEARKRDRLIDTVYSVFTIASLGLIFYGECWVYDYMTNINVGIKSDLGLVVSVQWPAVDPYLATPQALADYADALGLSQEAVQAINPQIANLRMGGGSSGRANIRAELGSQEAVDWSNFSNVQPLIGADGSFVGHTTEYATVMKAWGVLYKDKYTAKDPAAAGSPVDTLTNFVVNDKWYWGGVLGLSAIPILSLGIDTLRKIDLVEGFVDNA